MFLTKLFNGIDRGYLIKSYIVAVIFTYLLWQTQEGNHSLTLIIFCGVNLILFPFASVVWDDLISLMTGGMVVILPLPFLIIWKLIKIFLLYTFTIIIAPIGIIYILLANRLRNKE
ncbi:hypothetical protein [Metabacillus fastidiosus]|uniref:hypothetical protein n=1 Tax=Metabacillus fastidiosus TaxID=1458 RepID=UPI000825DCC0|nr:hypothetical protein [Metabacillus fastidiosus]